MTREMRLRLQRTKSKVQSFVHVVIEDTEVARILLEKLVFSDPYHRVCMEFSIVKELDQAVFLKHYSQLVTPEYTDVSVLKLLL